MHEIVALKTPLGGRPGLEIDAGAEEQADHFGTGQIDVRVPGYGDAVVTQAVQERRQPQALADGAGQQQSLLRVAEQFRPQRERLREGAPTFHEAQTGGMDHVDERDRIR